MNPFLQKPILLALPATGACLRPWCAADAAALQHHANDHGIWQNLRDSFPHPYTSDDAAYYLAQVADSPRDLHLALEVEGEAVGSVGVHFKSDVRRLSAEIGYWVGRNYWGRGLATEAVQAVSDYVFAHSEVRRLYAVVFATNAASGRVLQKCGYVLEATMRQSILKEGQILDSQLYAKIRE